MATRKKVKQTVKARGEDAIAYFERTTGKLTLARYLRAIRVGEEQTLEEFATILGVSKAHLSDVRERSPRGQRRACCRVGKASRL